MGGPSNGVDFISVNGLSHAPPTKAILKGTLPAHATNQGAAASAFASSQGAQTAANGDECIEIGHDQMPVLLDIHYHRVPLKNVVAGVVADAYHGLTNLTTTASRLSDLERKQALLRHSLSQRQQFIKLLALVRWAKDAKAMQRCGNIHGALDKTGASLAGAIGKLSDLYSRESSETPPSLDVATAVDVLSTGNYTRLPKVLEKTFLPPAPLTKEEIEKTVRTLESDIRVRVLVDEVVPSAMRRGMRIEKGCIHFHVENEFEVALTLQGVGKEAKWKLMNLKILVRSAGAGYESVPSGLNAKQTEGMGIAVQNRLLGRKDSRDPPHPITPPDVNAPLESGETKPAEKYWPLVELWECLHPFCLRMQLEVMKVQAEHLSRDRWRDRLEVDFMEGEGMLRLEFWKEQRVGVRRGVAARSSPTSRILEFKIHSEIPQADINWMKHANSVDVSLSPAGDDSKNKIHPAVAKSLTVGSEGRVKRWMQVRILKRGGEGDGEPLQEIILHDDEGRKIDFGVTGAELDVEKILLKVVEGLAKNVVLKIRDSLLPPPPATSSQSKPHPKKLKRKHGVAFEGVPRIQISSASTSTSRQNAPPSRYYAPHQLHLVPGPPTAVPDITPAPQLDVDFLQSKKIRIWVDVRTGRTRLSEEGSIGGGVEEREQRLREVEERVLGKGGVEGVREGLAWVAGEMMIDGVERVAGGVGLVGLRKVGVLEKELLKLSDPLPAHKTFLRFRGFADTYIVVGVGFRPRKEGEKAEVGMELQWRVWVMTTRSTGYEGEYVIETATPLKIGDALGGRNMDVDAEDGVPDIDDRGRKRRTGPGGVSVKVEREVVPEVSEEEYWWDKLDTDSLLGVESACR
ncbi:Mediator of RNA polymerase II transcription subunit 14, partial [Rhizophlyctis rosea]